VARLLEKEEISELELVEEPRTCRANDIAYISFPVPDRGLPASIKEPEQLFRRLSVAIADGKAIH
jgi:hypothetical protein